jgi:type II secretory pathway pseudopilin PulG
MTFNSTITSHCATKLRRAAFTLVEVLVATLFMVVVIPVALGGMRVASLAGESAQRKLVAARVANKVLNNLRVENLLLNGGQRGSVLEDGVSYNWSQQNDFWNGDPRSRLYVSTITVQYNVAGRLCNVQLSVLVPPSIQ